MIFSVRATTFRDAERHFLRYDIEFANQAGVDVIALRCGGSDDSQLIEEDDRHLQSTD